MTQEEKKDLLLKDICSRLPYFTKAQINNEIVVLDSICNDDGYYFNFIDNDREGVNIENIKPYLFPLTSMTEEQKEELFFNYIHNDIYFDDFTDYFLAGELWHDITVSIDILPSLIDWFNKNKIDWRGLIPMGLAIDATGLNIY